jgi:hypothetical protein
VETVQIIVAGQKSWFHSRRMIRFANHPAPVGMTRQRELRNVEERLFRAACEAHRDSPFRASRAEARLIPRRSYAAMNGRSSTFSCGS